MLAASLKQPLVSQCFDGSSYTETSLNSTSVNMGLRASFTYNFVCVAIGALTVLVLRKMNCFESEGLQCRLSSSNIELAENQERILYIFEATKLQLQPENLVIIAQGERRDRKS